MKTKIIFYYDNGKTYTANDTEEWEFGHGVEGYHPYPPTHLWYTQKVEALDREPISKFISVSTPSHVIQCEVMLLDVSKVEISCEMDGVPCTLIYNTRKLGHAN